SAAQSSASENSFARASRDKTPASSSDTPNRTCQRIVVTWFRVTLSGFGLWASQAVPYRTRPLTIFSSASTRRARAQPFFSPASRQAHRLGRPFLARRRSRPQSLFRSPATLAASVLFSARVRTDRLIFRPAPAHPSLRIPAGQDPSC